jgi:tRNA A37 threonylcarbamoyltransferase TsaD
MVRSSVVASQIDRHARFGGVVPEIASRAHVELLTPVVGGWFGGTVTLTRDVTGHIFSGAACDPS